MTAVADHEHSTRAAQLSEIATLLDRAREGDLPPAQAVNAIGRVLRSTDQAEVYQKPWG